MLFYVLVAAGVLASWAAMLWAVRNERERRETARQMEEFRVNLEKLRLAIALALVPSFEKMAVAMSRVAEAFRKAGVPAAEFAEKLRNIERRRP